MSSEYDGTFRTGTVSCRPEWRANYNGKQIIVHRGVEGCLWTWTDQGQVGLCSGNQARQWCLEHVVPEDRESLFRICPPTVEIKRSPLDNIAVRNFNRLSNKDNDDERQKAS